MATGLVEYTIAGTSTQKDNVALLTMTSDVPSLSPSSVLEGFNYQAVRRQFRDRWHDHLSAGAEVGFPDQNLRPLWPIACISRYLDRGQVMTPGALTVDDCWIRDSAFMIHALDKHPLRFSRPGKVCSRFSNSSVKDVHSIPGRWSGGPTDERFGWWLRHSD